MPPGSTTSGCTSSVGHDRQSVATPPWRLRCGSVSDLPPPPPPLPSATPPPPPPPNLVAPPGYSGYAGSPIGRVSLKRVGGLARATTILVLATALMSFVDLAVRQTVTDEADQFLADVIDRDEFFESIIGYVMIGMVQGLLQVAAAVVTMIWMFRVAANHRALHRGGTWGPGFGVAGWFLPPIIYVIPTLMLRELWKASDPDVPIGGDWRSRRGSPLPLIWFLLYTVVPLISLVSSSGGVFDQFSGSEESIAETITGDQTADIVVAAVTVAAAAVFVMLVRQLTARHCRLTGERAG